VALGTDFLDAFQTDKGTALYIGLEDSRQQLQELFEKMLENRNIPMDEDPDLIIITGEEFEKGKSKSGERKSRIKIL